MKIYVFHDKRGNIKSTAATQVESVGVKPPTGLSVFQLEHPNSNPVELGRHLQDIHHNFIVKKSAGKSELVRKLGKKKVR